MKSIPTPHTKTGRTKRELTLQTSGPSRTKEDLVVPAGTKVHFIGHWVVEDLAWLREEVHAGWKRDFPGEDTSGWPASNSITYHDADHYGIPVPAEEVVDIQEKA